MLTFFFCRHPNIVRFIGVSLGGAIPCTIVTELCRNGDLYEFVHPISHFLDHVTCLNPPFYVQLYSQDSVPFLCTDLGLDVRRCQGC